MSDDDTLEVLLIEDNPGDVRLIEELLAEATERTVTLSESDPVGTPRLQRTDRLDDGLQRLEASQIDVLLLDLGLPDSSGIDTLEAVRNRTNEVPVVVLTGVQDETVGVQAVQQGAQEYLVKDELTPPLLYRSIRHAIERKKFERTQAALHGASRDLVQAESKAEVSQLAVDTAVDLLGRRYVGIYLLDVETNVLEPAAYPDYLETSLGDIPSLHPNESTITWQAFVDDETVVREDLQEVDCFRRFDVPLRSGLWIPLDGHGVLVILSEEADGIDQQTQQLADHLAATTEVALDRVEREESLRRQERELATQNQQLEELNRINDLIREIDQVLVQAATRDAIEQAVCELLTQTERFAFAWIGEVVDDEITPRSWAGAGADYLDVVSLSVDDSASPAATMVSTETTTVVPNVASGIRDEPWRKAAIARGLQSAISIPLRYNELLYGVLTVFATEPDVFTDRSKRVFEELGETIAYAMNSVETRRTLLTDTVVELELEIRETGGQLEQLAREAGCQLSYGGLVPQTDGTTRIFFNATGASPNAVVDAATTVPGIRDIDYIGEGTDADQLRFEVTVSGPTVPSVLVECGGIARSIQIEETVTRVIVELPDTTDVRAFISRVEEKYSETELRARRDKERTDRSQEAFDTTLEAELTHRQLEVLQTAYHSGYFEWPRDRTGEEVATSLDITQPTFNAHLRTAERKLCAMLFDDGPVPSERRDQHT
ncbi:bacterio-opsin activator domain-containing protein [Haloprofundus salinisoli]|uniref:bacterio-opsin activator domain-containing protein n=1 Tax=Haloprofundus salinisoli TaxID=2876193 RepID=UPI001CCC6B7D|nr:bacterio-opsin activator domain-containing protein [Haloprofundus salinisoli]